MSKTVLVPIDVTLPCEEVLTCAAALASGVGGRAILVGAAEFEDQREAGNALIDLAASTEWRGVAVTCQTYPGDPVAAIHEATVEFQPDLIVMGGQARGEFDRLFHRSVIDEVVRSTEVPVLVVPAKCAHPWTAAGAQRVRVLVALDGSSFSEEAIEVALEFAGAFLVDLILFHAVEPIAPLFGSGYSLTELDTDVRRDAARQLLEDIAARLRERGQTVETMTAVGPVPATIARSAVEAQADFIVMATHGLGGLARVMIGSTAPDVVHVATVPVLLVHSNPHKAVEEGAM